MKQFRKVILPDNTLQHPTKHCGGQPSRGKGEQSKNSIAVISKVPPPFLHCHWAILVPGLYGNIGMLVLFFELNCLTFKIKIKVLYVDEKVLHSLAPTHLSPSCHPRESPPLPEQQAHQLSFSHSPNACAFLIFFGYSFFYHRVLPCLHLGLWILGGLALWWCQTHCGGPGNLPGLVMRLCLGHLPLSVR